MAGEAELRYSVLGTLAVERGGRPVDVGHAKQRAVLALLLVHANRPLTAEQIADALWSGRPPQSSLATLQSYVSNLRRALEPDRVPRTEARVLQTTAGGYRLCAEAIDALRFGELLSAASAELDRAPQAARELLVEALGLWRGPAYADFRYEEFAQAEIERLEELRVTALELRIAADLALGAASELVPELDALVRQHPLRERLRAQQMLALYRAGRQTEALAVYRDVTTELRDELGLDPGTELRDLQLAILEHDPRLLPPGRKGSRRMAEAGRRPAPDLVGRDRERRQLAVALEQAADGRGSVVIVQGEAGIGKTRLLERFHHDAQGAGARTAFARCVEVGGTPPFWPWTQLVRQLGPEEVLAAAGDDATQLAPILPQRSEPVSAFGTPLHRVADAVVASFRGLTASAPLVLVLDDLYSADPDSLALLTLVAASLDGVGVVIVGSHRGLDLGPTHPLSEALSQLTRFEWVERITMQPFAAAEVAALVSQVTGSEVEGDVVEAIRHRTNGNALYAIELTKLLHSQQQLDAESAWRAVPGSIRDVVSSRVNQLSADAVRLLRAGSVAGREFAVRDLADVLSLDAAAMVDAADEALAAGLIREADRPGIFRFAHVIVVDAVVDSLGSIRLAQIHGSLAEALERELPHDPGLSIDIAHHRVEAIPLTGPLPAIAALARAGRHAMASQALGLAERLFRQRRELVDDLPDSPSRAALEIDALLDLVRVLTWHEGYHSSFIGEATARLWELTGLGRGTPEIDTTAPILPDDPVLSTLQARFSYVMVHGDSAGAHMVVERFLDLAAAHPDPMIVVGANIAATVLGVHAPQVAAAVHAAERTTAALEVLDPDGSNVIMLPLGQQAARVTHHAFAGWAYYLAGDRARSRSELGAAREWCERLHHPFSTGFCVAVGCIVAAMDGDPDLVADAVAWGRSAFDEGQFGLFDVWLELMSAWVDGTRGDPAGAARRCRTLLGALEERGAPVVLSLFWGLTADLEGRAGHGAGMLDAACRGIEHADRLGERFWYPALERIVGEACGMLGRPDEQRAANRRAAESATELGIRPLIERFAASPAS